MRLRTPLLSLLFAAGSALANTPADFGLEVLVDGAPRPEYAARGTVYVEALRGRDFSLRVTNSLGVRVAVALSVDGLNTIDARHTSARDARKWVLDPYQSVVIPGWQVSGDTSRKFYFTGETRSYGAALGQRRTSGRSRRCSSGRRRRTGQGTKRRSLRMKESARTPRPRRRRSRSAAPPATIRRILLLPPLRRSLSPRPPSPTSSPRPGSAAGRASTSRASTSTSRLLPPRPCACATSSGRSSSPSASSPARDATRSPGARPRAVSTTGARSRIELRNTSGSPSYP